MAHLQACKQPQEQCLGGLQKEVGNLPQAHPPTTLMLPRPPAGKHFCPQATQSQARLGPGCCCGPGSGVSALSCMPSDSNRARTGKPQHRHLPCSPSPGGRERMDITSDSDPAVVKKSSLHMWLSSHLFIYFCLCSRPAQQNRAALGSSSSVSCSLDSCKALPHHPASVTVLGLSQQRTTLGSDACEL